MISLSRSNKFIYFIFFIYILLFNYSIGNSAVDIWEKKENDQSNTINNEKEMFAWPYLNPRTIIAMGKNFKFFFRTGDWPTPYEQIKLMPLNKNKNSDQ